MTKQNINDIEWQGRFAHQKAILFNEDDLDSKGTKLQIIKIEPGSTIEPHYHNVRTEVFYILKGKGNIRQNDDILDVSVGDYLLCRPGTIHAFKNNGTDELMIAVFRTNDPGDSDMLWVEDNS